MDDKTAAIPSLKDFKNKGNSKPAGSAKNKPASRKPLSQDTMRIDKVGAGKLSSGVSSKNTQTRKKPASAPSVYAKDRVRGSASQQKPSRQEYDSSRRVDRTAQTQRRDNMQKKAPQKPPAKPRQSPGAGYYEDIYSSSAKNVPKGNPQSPPPARKPAERKPVQRKPQPPRPSAPKKVKKAPTEKSIKAKKILLIVSLSLIFVVAMGILSLTVFFKAKSIVVEGLDRYEAEKIITASGISKGDNIIVANKSQAEERIESLYPYIEEADVYAQFPDKIKIDVKMAKPAYKFESNGGMHIVSGKGKVLEVSKDEAVTSKINVPLLTGIHITGRAEGEFVDYENDVVSDALASINDTFVELDCKNITEIDIRVKGKAAEFRYLYDNRIVVYLGIPEELPYKIKAADTVLKRLDSEDMTNMGELDVSNCHEDSNCYFNPVSILAPDSTAPNTTETSQEELEVPVEY